MRSNSESWDLYKLFKVVKEKGGYDAVCKSRLWDLVGKEYGLGVNVGSSVKHVYSKHLSALEACLKNVADGKFPKCGSGDDRDRFEFRKRLMEVQAESLSKDYGEEEAGNEHERKVCDSPDGTKLCGSNIVKGKNLDSSGDESDKVCDSLDGRKLCRTIRVEGVDSECNGAQKDQSDGLVDLDTLDCVTHKPIPGNFCSFNTARDILEVFGDGKIVTVDAFGADSNMPRLSDGSKSSDNDHDNDSDEVLILDLSGVDKESFGRKRKRESKSKLLSWVTSTAKNPGDPAVGSMPEKSKWKSYGSQEIWKQMLLFREAAFLKKDFETISEKLSWLGQRMHPSMYDDPDRAVAMYNLRQRLKCDKKPLLEKSTSDQVSSASSGRTHGGLKRTPIPKAGGCSKKRLFGSCTASSSFDKCARVHVPVGPKHQAKVPGWTGMTYESDSKWLGTQIWPPETVNSKQHLFEREPIGKGRQDSCGCQVQGSVECVRFHICMKRSKLNVELGKAFYQWNLHKVGEEVRGSWTQQEEKKFKEVVKSSPASHDKCFWDQLFKTFPKKSREDLVSYYFNVFLLQRRAYQNRHTPDDIDSDDDESEFTTLKNVFGHQNHNSRSYTLLSPKKSTNKEK